MGYDSRSRRRSDADGGRPGLIRAQAVVSPACESRRLLHGSVEGERHGAHDQEYSPLVPLNWYVKSIVAYPAVLKYVLVKVESCQESAFLPGHWTVPGTCESQVKVNCVETGAALLFAEYCCKRLTFSWP